MKSIGGLVVAVATVLACGGGSGAFTRNDPGIGSSTLKIAADIDGSASGAAYTGTVSDGVGASVSGATVTIANPNLTGGQLRLTEVTANTGKYTSASAAFPAGDFQLGVAKGNDFVRGVIVGGIGAHTINSPAVNSKVAANQPLAISWTTPSQSKQASISTKNMQFDGLDTGTYTIAGAMNPVNSSQKVQIDRENQVEIAGGLMGSRLRVTYSAKVEPFIVQ
jgi:hypothetical protein